MLPGAAKPVAEVPMLSHPTLPHRQVQQASLSDIALTGVYEISKILTSKARLETTLSNVLNVLSSFLQMRHGVISLLGDDDVPEIILGTNWNEGARGEFWARQPKQAIDQVVATAVPLVVENIAKHDLFESTDLEAFGADEETIVSFIGVPIRGEGKVIGTLAIDRVWDGKSIFRLDSDVRFLTMIANLIGQTVQLYRIVARDRERLIAESHRLQKELSDLKPEGALKHKEINGIIGNSPAIRGVMGKIEVVAKSHAPVLLRGESGTGKELFARAIHELSNRASGPFIKVNCAALPETVLESELFGHEKGAFTGALNARKGRFELADHGTLFLDEIGEISASFQAKLLRVLQEGEFERVGGNKTIKVDVRIVTATNRDLEEAVAKKEFRADLYYRINVVSLMLPPLRERKSDIPLLAREFLERFNSENGRSLSFAPGAIAILQDCYFPGNVRELQNCIERTATLTHGATIERADFACALDQCLSSMLWRGKDGAGAEHRPGPAFPLPVVDRAPKTVETRKTHDAFEAPAPAPAPAPEGGMRGPEYQRLIDAMERSGWVQAKAARILGLTPRQIGYALKKYDIPIRKF